MSQQQAAALAPPARRWWLWAAVLLALGLVVAGATAIALTALRPHRAVMDVPTAAGLPRAAGDLQAGADALLASVSGSIGSTPIALAFGSQPAPGSPQTAQDAPLLLVGGRLGLFSDADEALRRATAAFAASAFRSGTGPVPFTDQPAGPLGGRQRCAQVDVAGVTTAVCGWADESTVGLAVSALRSPEQLADLLGRARLDLER